MMDNEFGFRTHQMRTPYIVKNAWIFEILDANKVKEVLEHGDVDNEDILTLCDSGRDFLIFQEDGFDQHWKPWFREHRDISSDNWGDPEPLTFSIINTMEFETFARIVVHSGDFMFQRPRRSVYR